MTTQKSFPKGSAFPPLSKGTLRLYSMRFCPYAQRTRLVLAYKKIPFETINVDLRPEKPEWFLERNPKGLVPTLEQDDKIIYESLITCDYLDEVYPDNRLTPTDPYRKARDGMLIDFYANKFVTNHYKLGFSQAKDEEAKETYIKAIQKLEEELTARGQFFGGEKPTMVDLMLWPWLERCEVLQIMCESPDLAVTAERFPKLHAYIQRMSQQPCVKTCGFDTQTYIKFYESRSGPKPNYDYGLE